MVDVIDNFVILDENIERYSVNEESKDRKVKRRRNRRSIVRCLALRLRNG